MSKPKNIYIFTYCKLSVCVYLAKTDRLYILCLSGGADTLTFTLAKWPDNASIVAAHTPADPLVLFFLALVCLFAYSLAQMERPTLLLNALTN